MSGNANGMHWIRDEKREQIYWRDDHRCVYCGRIVRKNATLDHVLSRERGGGNEATNLVTCCPRCNRLKEECHDVLDVFAWTLAKDEDDVAVDILMRVAIQTHLPLPILTDAQAGPRSSG